jgi:hypothetical protein
VRFPCFRCFRTQLWPSSGSHNTFACHRTCGGLLANWGDLPQDLGRCPRHFGAICSSKQVSMTDDAIVFTSTSPFGTGPFVYLQTPAATSQCSPFASTVTTCTAPPTRPGTAVASIDINFFTAEMSPAVFRNCENDDWSKPPIWR